MWSKLLINESPLQVIPSLAITLGLNEAIALQQMHFWSDPNKNQGKEVDGRRWIRNSFREWTTKNFPWWGKSTIQRTFQSLVKTGFLFARNDLNGHQYDKTIWYSVHYDRVTLLAKLTSGKSNEERKKQDVKKLPPVPDWDTYKESLEVGRPRLGQPVPSWDNPSSQDGTSLQREVSQNGTTIPKIDTKAKEEITSKILISEKKSLWPDALDILETMMSKDIFNVALRGSKFVKVEEEVIFIRPANENAATWIEERVKAQVVNVSQYVLDPAINEVAIWAK